MAAIELQIDPRDREVYGGAEWVRLDRDQIDDAPYSQISRWERELGVSITQLLGTEFARGTALGIKGVVWLARQLSGAVEPSFADFDIRTRRVRHRRAAGDVDPPQDGSSEPPSGIEA